MDFLKRIIFILVDWIMPPLHILQIICIALIMYFNGRSILYIIPAICLIAYLSYLEHRAIKAPFQSAEEQPKWFRYLKDSIFKP